MDDACRSVRTFTWGVVGLTAVAFGVAVVAANPSAVHSPRGLVLATVLAVGAAVGSLSPLQLAARTKLYFDTAALTAAALLFEAPAAMAIAVVAMVFAQWRSRAPRDQALFNVAQTALYVGIGSAVFHALAGATGAFGSSTIAAFAAAIAAVTTMHAANSASVAGVVAAQTNAEFLPTWRQFAGCGLRAQAALSLLGMVIAAVGREQPWALLFLLAPVVGYSVAVRRIDAKTAPAPALSSSPIAPGVGD